jgi:hypothetical protein
LAGWKLALLRSLTNYTMGDARAAILLNHGLLTVVDAAIANHALTRPVLWVA